jgi:hypothetical protein
VLFYCATDAHARIVARAIAEVNPRGSGWFLIVSADAMHLDYSKIQFQTNAEIEGEGTLYEYLADLVLRPIFAQVESGAGGRPILGYHPLVEGPRLPAVDPVDVEHVTEPPLPIDGIGGSDAGIVDTISPPSDPTI